MPESVHSRWWIASEVVVGLAVLVLPWCLGGAPFWSLEILVGLSSLAFMLWAIGAVRSHRRWAPQVVLLVPLVLSLVALVQLLPMPPPLLQWLSPAAAELREFSLLPLGLTRWRPISMDAPSTARALARFLALGALLAVSLELGRKEAARRRLAMALALSGVSIALCGFLHLVLGEDALLGVHHFRTTLNLITPFGNTNHLAAWETLGGTVALGLALSARSHDEILGWVIAAIICGVAVFLSLSRGGVGSFVATLGLVGAAALSRKSGGIRAVFPWVVIAATVSFAGLLAFEDLAARAATVSTLERIQATKIELWPMMAKGIIHFWPLGMGLGAFELGFTRYQTEQLDVTFTHAENVALHYAGEVGIGMAGVLLVVIVIAGKRAWHEVKDSALERTLLIAVAGLLLHDVFDFSLELNAVSVGLAVLAGLACATRASGGPRQSVTGRSVALGAAISIVAFVALRLGSDTHNAAEAELRDALIARLPPAQTRALAVRLIDQHPADWVLYANGANDASRRGDPRESLAWVNRVLFLRPDDAHSHEAAARALLRLGKPIQALVELKSAWVLGQRRTLELGLAIAAKEDAFDRMLLDDQDFLLAAYQLLRAKGRARDAERLISAAAADSSELLRLEAQVLGVRHEADFGDAATALSSFDQLPESARDRAELVQVRVALLSKLGQRDEARRALEQLLSRDPSSIAVAVQLVDLYAAMGRPVAAREIITRARPFATTAGTRSELFQREASLWLSEDRLPRALDALQTASRLEPASADLHYRLAEIFERMGSVHSALEEVWRGRVLDSPEGAKARDAWADRLKAAELGLR